MIVRLDFPPNYEAINRRFRLDQFDKKKFKPIFAYGLFIFNPHRTKIPLELFEHEKVHSARQGSNPAGWWDQYLADDNFRLIEELAAHVIEYKVLVDHHRKTREARRRIFHHVASRLRSPLYGYQPPLHYDRAREFLKKGLKEIDKMTTRPMPQGGTITNPNRNPTAP